MSCADCDTISAQSARYYTRCMKHELDYRDQFEGSRAAFYREQWDQRYPDLAGQYPDWILALGAP